MGRVGVIAHLAIITALLTVCGTLLLFARRIGSWICYLCGVMTPCWHASGLFT